MKRILFSIVIIAFSCRSEEDVDSANGGTFIRYFGSENNHIAVMAEEADNGYTLLGNIEVENEERESIYKIRLAHTDRNGNTLWTQVYPDFEQVPISNNAISFKAASFITTENGYLIVGERIQREGTSGVGAGRIENFSLLLLNIDFNGNLLATKTVDAEEGKNLQGYAATIDQAGDIIVLAKLDLESEIDDAPELDMFVAKIDAETFFNSSDSTIAPEWFMEYGDGESTITNRVFINENNDILWGGSVIYDDESEQNMRLVITPQNSMVPKSASALVDADANEEALDICKTFSGYAIVGKMSQNLVEDIQLTLVRNDGTLQQSTSFDFSGESDMGNSVALSNDGGLVILGTVTTGSARGNGSTDLYLLKVDAAGNVQWDINYGGINPEIGASVRQVDNNGFLIFGTTRFGDLGKMVLMKVDGKGKL